MQTMLIILACLLLAEAAVLAAAPEAVKALLVKVSPAELRVAGIVELAAALPVLVFALLG